MALQMRFDLLLSFGHKTQAPIVAQTRRAIADGKGTRVPQRVQERAARVQLAQALFGPSQMINFFRPRYTPPVTELARRHLVAPELQITDETSIAGYLNFLAIYADRGWEDLQTTYAPEVALAHDPQALVARVVLLLAGDAFSAQTAGAIADAVATLPASRPRDRVRAAILLVAATPEYLVQK